MRATRWCSLRAAEGFVMVGGAGEARAGTDIRRRQVRAASRVAIVALAVMCNSQVFAGDDADSATPPALPNVYFDLRTNYATLPANSLSIGFGHPSPFTTLSHLSRSIDPAALSSPASQSA